jgi:heat shock protein HslJ
MTMHHLIRNTLLLSSLSFSVALLPGCAGAGEGSPSVETASPAVQGEWVVGELDGKQMVGDTEVVLTFGPGGSFSGDSGVNRLRAGYTLEGDVLELSEILATRMAGAPELMEQESRLMAALEAARGVLVTGDDRLRLVDGGGEVLLVSLRR